MRQPRRAPRHRRRRGTDGPRWSKRRRSSRCAPTPTAIAPDTTNGIWQDNQQFFHRGTSGQWRSLLDDAALARYFAARRGARARRHRAAGCTDERRSSRRRPRPPLRFAGGLVAPVLAPVVTRPGRRRRPPGPDPTLHPVGGPSTERGPNQLALLRHWGLRPSARVLEIGCGVGRLAYELAPYLDGGTYTGFDISPKAIDWLNEHYAPRLPNFRFDLVDARNVRYRPQGGDAETLRFPVCRQPVRRRCAFAVFMHMQLPEIRRYCERSRAVLAPDGFAAVTFRSVTDGRSAAADTRPRVGTRSARGSGRSSPRRPDARSRTTTRSCDRRSPRRGWSSRARTTGRWHKQPVDARHADLRCRRVHRAARPCARMSLVSRTARSRSPGRPDPARPLLFTPHPAHGGIDLEVRAPVDARAPADAARRALLRPGRRGSPRVRAGRGAPRRRVLRRALRRRLVRQRHSRCCASRWRGRCRRRATFGRGPGRSRSSCSRACASPRRSSNACPGSRTCRRSTCPGTPRDATDVDAGCARRGEGQPRAARVRRHRAVRHVDGVAHGAVGLRDPEVRRRERLARHDRRRPAVGRVPRRCSPSQRSRSPVVRARVRAAANAGRELRRRAARRAGRRQAARRDPPVPPPARRAGDPVARRERCRGAVLGLVADRRPSGRRRVRARRRRRDPARPAHRAQRRGTRHPQPAQPDRRSGRHAPGTARRLRRLELFAFDRERGLRAQRTIEIVRVDPRRSQPGCRRRSRTGSGSCSAVSPGRATAGVETPAVVSFASAQSVAGGALPPDSSLGSATVAEVEVLQRGDRVGELARGGLRRVGSGSRRRRRRGSRSRVAARGVLASRSQVARSISSSASDV